MSEKEGKIIICDRCGKVIFLGKTKSETVTHFPSYESKPPGWHFTREIGDLCPCCSDLWERMKNEFQLSISETIKRANLDAVTAKNYGE